MGDPIQQFRIWYHGKSIISKLYFTFSLIQFFLLYFNLWLSANHIYLDMETLSNFQIWRIWTALVFQNDGSIMVYAFKFYVSYSIIVNLQEKVFGKQNNKAYAQFMWITLITFIYVTGLTLVFNFYLTNHFFFMCLCCIWYHKKSNSSSKVFFGINIPIFYLRFSYAIYMWVMGHHGYWIQIIAAFAFGYAYHYLKFYSLSHYGRDFLGTPAIFESIIEKYLILQQRIGLVKLGPSQENQGDDDPYEQYGYYANNQDRPRRNNQQMNRQQQQQQMHQD